PPDHARASDLEEVIVAIKRHRRREGRDDDAMIRRSCARSAVVPHHLDKMVRATIPEAVLGQFVLDESPEARNWLASVTAVFAGIAAAAVAGVALASIVATATALRDLAIVTVAGALSAGIMMTMPAIGALSTALCDWTIVIVAGALPAGIM